MSSNPVAEGHYRIRKAGAKSVIAKQIWNGKKCHYVQIGIELVGFDSLDDAVEFVKDKGLVADKMSLDFGVKPAEPDDAPDEDDEVTEEPAEAVADGDAESA